MPPRSKHRQNKVQLSPVKKSHCTSTAACNVTDSFHAFKHENLQIVGHLTNVQTSIKKNDESIFVLCFAVHELCHFSETVTRHEISVPSTLQNELQSGKIRLIGKQMCTGHWRSVFLVQYMTSQDQYLRYLLADVIDNRVECIEDSIGYFHKSYLSFQTECVISPDCSWLLLRLPRRILANSRRWSMLPAITHDMRTVHDENLQDRLNMALAFNPTEQAQLTCVIVNYYCTSCHIKIQDLNRSQIVAEHDCQLPFRTLKQQDYMHVGSVEVCVPNVYLMLSQCSAIYSRCGRWLFLACMTRWGTNTTVDGVLLIYTLNAVNMQVVDIQQRPLAHSLFLLYLMPPVLDCHDHRVSLWGKAGDEAYMSLDLLTELPVAMLSLKDMCCMMIRRHCPCRYIPDLGLPSPLKAYLLGNYFTE